MKRWEVCFQNEAPKCFDDSSQAACEIVQNEDYINGLEVDIDQTIDGCYGHIEINGTDYWASNILKELDEDAYDSYLSSERGYVAEANQDYVCDTLDRMDDGDEESFEGGICVRCFEESDEDDSDEDPRSDGLLGIFDIV